MSIDKQIHLLDDLENMLEKQIELAHQGNLRGIEALSGQTDSLTEEIGRLKILESAEFKSERECLVKLYNDLQFALTVEKEETGKQLQQTRRARRTIRAYRNNIQEK